MNMTKKHTAPAAKKKSPLLILAPMAGITDLPFRIVCKELGAGIVYSEMISASGLSYNNKAKSLALVNSCTADQPLFVQLFGSKPEDFATATKLIDRLPKRKSLENSFFGPCRPEGIDINFGCPVKKVLKQNSGCALMKDPELSYKIIETVLKNTSLPVSIKIRAGIGKIDALKFIDKVGPLNWQTLIVHGRTYRDGFSGPIDLELIRKIKGLFPNRTIIANGGIFSPETAKKTLEKTGADGVAIARGALGNPWIFNQTKEFIQTGKYQEISAPEKHKIILRHLDLAQKYLGENRSAEFKKHLGWYFKGAPGSKKIRAELFSAGSFAQMRSLVKSTN